LAGQGSHSALPDRQLSDAPLSVFAPPNWAALGAAASRDGHRGVHPAVPAWPLLYRCLQRTGFAVRAGDVAPLTELLIQSSCSFQSSGVSARPSGLRSRGPPFSFDDGARRNSEPSVDGYFPLSLE
jgi:hypothetical protein